MPTWDVFLSYSTQDKRYVAKVHQELENRGLKVWRDASAIRPGQRLRDAINAGIQDSAAVAIFCSPRSLSSQWVLNELDMAMLRELRERRIVVLPVLMGQVQISDLPQDIQGKLCFDFRGGFDKEWEDQRERFISAVHYAAAEVSGYSPEFIPVGDELVGRFIGHDFHGDDVTARVVAVMLAAGYTDLFTREDDHMLKAAFVEKYGTFALEKMIVYWMDMTGFRPGVGESFEPSETLAAMDATRVTLAAFGAVHVLRETNPELRLVAIPQKETGELSFSAVHR